MKSLKTLFILGLTLIIFGTILFLVIESIGNVLYHDISKLSTTWANSEDAILTTLQK